MFTYAMFSTGSRKTVQLGGEDRRHQIILGAIRAFSRWGFRGSTTKRLARETRISEALLYRYFRNKEELFKSVLDYMRCNFKVSLPEASLPPSADDDREFFCRLAAGIQARFIGRPEDLRMLLHAALEQHPLALDYFKEQSRPIYEAVTSRIIAGQAQGRYRQVEPSIAARSFIGMINYNILIRVLFEDTVIPGWKAGEVAPFVDLFLNGISHESS